MKKRCPRPLDDGGFCLKLNTLYIGVFYLSTHIFTFSVYIYIFIKILITFKEYLHIVYIITQRLVATPLSKTFYNSPLVGRGFRWSPLLYILQTKWIRPGVANEPLLYIL